MFYSIHIIIFLLLLFIFIIFYMTCISKSVIIEQFLSKYHLIADEKPEKILISKPEYLKGSVIKELENIKNVEIIENSNMTKKNTQNNIVQLHIEDTFLYSERKKQDINLRFLSYVPQERVFFIIIPIDGNEKTMFSRNLRIGHFNNEEDILFRMLYSSSIFDSSLNVPFLDMSLKQVKAHDNKIDAEFFIKNNIDCLAMFTSLDSNYVKMIDNNLKLDVIDYGEFIDNSKLKVLMPFVKKRNIDFSIYLKQLQGKRDTVKNVFTFDCLLYGHMQEDRKNIMNEFNEILLNVNRPELINYYSKYFTPYPIALRFAQDRNEFTKERSKMQILEQFNNDNKDNNDNNKTIIINQNVNGFYDSHNRIFTTNSIMLIGIPLQIGIKFQFNAQHRDEENGMYIVKSVAKNSALFSKIDRKLTEKSNILNQFKPGYHCYNHPNIQSKGLCENAFDEIGKPKREKTYWDKPCSVNIECPFYQSNKNYKNYRGGCINGRCEMPLGIKQVAYRLYDENNKALCHNCKDWTNPYCCEEQKDNKLYPMLKSPDYAFPFDEFERLNSSVS
jgi:hypothetical protein